MTRAKQRLAEQAAFFIGVPPSVFVHELAHAVAIWLFGGRIAEFGYRVFWGYVVPEGSFTAVQNWIIALAGTLGSLGFGVIVWWLLRLNPSRTFQYFGKRTFRFQIYFSLLYYPLFSLFLPIGDWRMIYDFQATPVAAAVAALAHATALFLFWRADRRGWFEMPAFESVAEQTAYETTQVAAAAGDESARLRVIDSLRRGGAQQTARRLLEALIRQQPDSAAAQLQLAALLTERQGAIGKEAAAAAQRALDSGLPHPNQVAYAHRLLATYHLERGDGRAAEAELDRALAQTTGTVAPSVLAELYAGRSQARRRNEQYQAAFQDIQTAIDLARAADDSGAVALYEEEMQVIAKNARLPMPERPALS